MSSGLSLARRQDPESIRNFRIPALDLDSVYGGGPGVSPHLYDRGVDGGRTTMLTEEIAGSAAVSVDGSLRHDLPRNSQQVALIGDPRNDENLILSQLHLAMLRFHNVVVADVKAELGAGFTAEEIFAEAQRIVRWHYFGTSPTDPAQQFFAVIFDPAAADPADPADLHGGVRAARRFIDWQTFFDFGDSRVRPNKKIDTTLSSVLFNLMGLPPGTASSLASRNLLRALTMGVPSGQRVAKAMKLLELAPGELADLKDLSLHLRTPLWF